MFSLCCKDYFAIGAVVAISVLLPMSTEAATFTRTLKYGDSGSDVADLQRLLNANPLTTIASSGPGSPGNESTYFGGKTSQALAKFQSMHANEILVPVGLSKPSGVFGPITQSILLKTAGNAQSSSSNSSASISALTRTLKYGDSGSDVTYLQKLLNQNPTTAITGGGSGSPGNESTFFGTKTMEAVIRFQKLYASEILYPAGVSVPTGVAGPSTRTKLWNLYGNNSGSSQTGSTSSGSTGGGVTGNFGAGGGQSAPGGTGTSYSGGGGGTSGGGGGGTSPIGAPIDTAPGGIPNVVPPSVDTTSPPPASTSTPAVLPADHLFGAYTGAACSAAVSRFENFVGRKMEAVQDSLPPSGTMKYISDTTLWFSDCWKNKKNFTGLLSVSVPLAASDATFADIASGKFDTNYKYIASTLIRYGYSNAVIRLGWEFNGGWYTWAAQKNPSGFIAAWQHVVDVMRSVPGQNFKFNWSSAIGYLGLPTDRAYPGDNYVDFIGMDVYDTWWSPASLQNDPAGRWNQLLTEEYGLNWLASFSTTHGKPISIPEWGTGERPDGHGGGDDPYFVTHMAAWIKSHNVNHHMYWDNPSSEYNSIISSGAHPLSGAAYLAAFGPGGTNVSPAVATDTTPPTGSITTPANGSTLIGSIAIGALASDDVGVANVQFQFDGTTFATVASSPYSTMLDTTTKTNGTHTIGIKVSDAAGNSNTYPITVTISNTPVVQGPDATPPTITFSAPANNATVTGTITISGTATDNVAVTTVQYLFDGVVFGPTQNSSPFSTTLDTTTKANGSHTIGLSVADAAGNTATASRTITINNVPPDTTAPTGSITSPTNNATVSGTISIQTSASDNVAVANVKYTYDGYLFGGTYTVSPYTQSLDTTTKTNGTHSLTAVITDTSGNVAYKSVTINIQNGVPDTTIPTGGITSPTNNSTISGTITITSTASDNVAVANVKYTFDGTLFGSTLTSAPYSQTLDTTTKANGSHSITEVITDTSGNVAYKSITVTISN